jgi:hypothetical protein
MLCTIQDPLTGKVGKRMARLTKQAIFDVEDITEKEVSVPEWGGEVLIRSLSYREMGKIKKNLADENGEVDDALVEKRIFVNGCIDPEFTEEEYDDYILSKNASAVMTILNAIMGASKTEENSVKETERQFRSPSERIPSVPDSGDAGDDSARTSDRAEASA